MHVRFFAIIYKIYMSMLVPYSVVVNDTVKTGAYGSGQNSSRGSETEKMVGFVPSLVVTKILLNK